MEPMATVVDAAAAKFRRVSAEPAELHDEADLYKKGILVHVFDHI